MRSVYHNWQSLVDDLRNVRKKFERSDFIGPNKSFFRRHPAYEEFEKPSDITDREKKVYSVLKALWKDISGGKLVPDEMFTSSLRLSRDVLYRGHFF